MSEFCPSCGKYVDALIDYTGWCRSCSPVGYCDGCGEQLTPGQVKANRRHCNICQLEVWLILHGDELDFQLSLGLTFAQATQVVQLMLKPRCSSCGGLINHVAAKRVNDGIIFCTKNAKCRKARRRLKYYLYDQRLPRTVAVQKVLTELKDIV